MVSLKMARATAKARRHSEELKAGIDAGYIKYLKPCRYEVDGIICSEAGAVQLWRQSKTPSDDTK